MRIYSILSIISISLIMISCSSKTDLINDYNREYININIDYYNPLSVKSDLDIITNYNNLYKAYINNTLLLKEIIK